MFTKNKIFFKKTEANLYFNRNKKKIIDYEKDWVTKLLESAIKKLRGARAVELKVLEIGCGDAKRLIFLKKKFPSIKFFGIDPLSNVIKNKDIFFKKSTADHIPFKSNYFDMIIYGFCLYLADDYDLFKIAFEADRFSKFKSIIAIYDFYSKKLKYKKYKHNKKIFVRKMNYSKLFSWHPYYKIKFLKIKKYERKDYLSFILLKKEQINHKIL